MSGAVFALTTNLINDSLSTCNLKLSIDQMGFYFQTSRAFADNPSKLAVLKKESVRFSIYGWTEFAKVLRADVPWLSNLLSRVDWGGDVPEPEKPMHPVYVKNGQPLELTWTADECRQLFLGLCAASKNATETAYDFWEFLAMVCCGINEEGIVVY
jgi:hypothetical protein